jgi:glycosyltransferase involved in cell wall biosynthesis
MKPLVSVTMSAFNVEKYLSACLDCVVNQTLREIEIICVNDGSTDGTLTILKEYAARDSRLKIIDKSVNEGLAVARNEALAMASGKYVGFVDGDDLLDRDLFRKAYERAEETQSDLLLWDYVSFRSEDEIERKTREPSGINALDPRDKIGLLERPAFTWTKLLRTDKARVIGVNFPKGLTYQDIPVHWKLVTKLDKIAILSERLSYYRQQPEATTHRTGWKRADLVVVMDMVGQYLRQSNLYETYRDFFLRQQLERLYGLFDIIDPTFKKKVLKLIDERMGEDQLQYIDSDKPLRWQVRDFYRSRKGSTFSIMRRAVWLKSRSIYRAIKSR